MRQTINGADFRRMMLSAAASIEIHKQQLNDLNVFPVPDGDTGTNMSMTINAAATDLRKTEDPSLERAAAISASAMLRGARGNSGVILSLLLRGISKRLKGAEECDGVLWAEALQEGVDAAYKAVMKPAEGTILTVARLAAAKAVRTAKRDKNFETVHAAAIEEAKIALDNTGVASCTTQHGRCSHLGSLAQSGVLSLAQVAGSGVDGHGHIGAGIAVGDGEHVQLVQSLLVDFNGSSSADDHSAKIGAVDNLFQIFLPPNLNRSSWNRYKRLRPAPGCRCTY